MGEDFVTKRNDRSNRYRDESLREELRPDLFSTCSPQTTVVVQGMVVTDSPVGPNSEIWSPPLSAEGPIQFYYGDTPVIEIAGSGAEYIRNECGVGERVVIGQVMEVNAEDGLAKIRVGGAEIPL